MSKIALVDLETTGLDPQQHEIIEIGAILFDSHTLEIINDFQCKIMPTRDIDPKAQEVNGFNYEEWLKGCSDIKIAMDLFSEFTKDCVFMAFNSHFDLGFLDEASKNTGARLNFLRYTIDLRSIAWHVMPHTSMFKWSLKEVCEKLGVAPEPAVHRAMNGVMCEFEVYKKLVNIKSFDSFPPLEISKTDSVKTGFKSQTSY